MQPQADRDERIIEMLDTLAWLRNGDEIWTMVPKDFDLYAANAFLRLHFECCKPGQSPFEILLGATVAQRLVDEGCVKPATQRDGHNANNQKLFLELEPKGEQWYLQEYPQWKGSLDHKPTPPTSDAV